MTKIVTVAAIAAAFLSTIAPVQAAWAVAGNQSGSGVLVSQRAFEGQAKNDVRRECRQRYKNCEVISSGFGGCVAVAWNGMKWTVAVGRQEKDTDAQVMADCKAASGRSCQLAFSHCGS